VLLNTNPDLLRVIEITKEQDLLWLSIVTMKKFHLPQSENGSKCSITSVNLRCSTYRHRNKPGVVKLP
jgi:Tfp pilus assembly protein PilO